MSEADVEKQDLKKEIRAVNRELSTLAETLREFEKTYKRAIGFTHTIEYRDVSFNVGCHCVVADLAPLAFVHLAERLDHSEEVPAAVARLYHRLEPLLTCKHQWEAIQRNSETAIQKIANDALDRGSAVHMCQRCTAYALQSTTGTLPTIGLKK